MVIKCPKCSTQYKYDEARFGDARSKRLKCPKCSDIFEVQNPSEDEDDSTLLGTGPKADDDRNSVTDQVRVDPEQPELPELAPLPGDVRYSLAVIAGAQAGSVFKLTKPRAFIGRGSNMDVQLKDGEVSRRHSMIEIRGDKVMLIDMGATNGTFVDGERITNVELPNQGEFTLGSSTLMLIITHDHEISL